MPELSVNRDASPPPVARRGPGRPKGSTNAPKTTGGNTERRAKGLKDLSGLGVGILVMTRQYADAGALTNHGDPIADEVAKLADQHEGVASVVDKMLESGPYAGLIAAVVPLAMQLAVNHGIIKGAPSMGGKVVPKEVLEAHVKGELDRQATVQREAYEREIAAAREANAVANGHR